MNNDDAKTDRGAIEGNKQITIPKTGSLEGKSILDLSNTIEAADLIGDKLMTMMKDILSDHLERDRRLFTQEGFCRLHRGALSQDELLAAGAVFTEYPELAVKLDIVFDYVIQIKEILGKAYD